MHRRRQNDAMIFRIALAVLAAVIVAAPVRAVHLSGMDVSVYQKKIDWKTVQAAGIKFAFTKATEGNAFVDSRFKENMAGAAAVGIPIGPYHFARPDNDRDNPQDAADEANHFVDTIESYYNGPALVIRPVIDVEKLPGFDKPAKNKAFLSQWIHQFAATVNKRLGFNPIIYANSNYAKNYFEKDVSQYELWLANWTLDSDKPPAKSQNGIWDKWHFWQYTSHGAVDGIRGRVYRDVFEGTMLELAQFVPNFHPGDYDGNGRVDDRDKAVWRKMKGQTVNPGTGADGDLSGTVDDADLAVWKANNGKSYANESHRSPAKRDK
jgi:lysozyme